MDYEDDMDRPGNTVVLYHRTTKAAAAAIRRSCVFGRGKENDGAIYFSTRKSGQAEGYGDGVVKVVARKSDVEVDDEFGNGEVHVRILGNKRHLLRIVGCRGRGK